MTVNSLGRWGEDKAVEFLTTKGYRILERNYRNWLGEIDIVASEKKTVCFVEVKTRRSLICGLPYESVTRRKQVKMTRLAFAYLKHRFGTVDVNARFDVVSIVIKEQGAPHIEHIRNAFDVTY